MKTIIFRTEDLSSEDIKNYYVETKIDRDNIEFLKSSVTGLLVGSRGTGKTFLLKKAEQEMVEEFESTRTLPVFVSFSKAAFVSGNGDCFKKWMLSKILFALQGQLQKIGIIKTNIFAFILGAENNVTSDLGDKISKMIDSLESSWKGGSLIEDGKISNIVDDIDYFKKLIEEICNKSNISRIIFLYDEACHNFIPKQQREFFTIFRDLRTSFICGKAAVYPGLTSFGTFEIFHDSVVKKVEKNILEPDYIDKMRDIIKKQIDIEAYNKLIKQGELLDSLIWASTGNPRILLLSVYEASGQLKQINTQSTNETLKEFYRTKIWNEYTKLGTKFPKYKEIIDWGREFIEKNLIPEVLKKNERSKNEEDYDKTTAYFIIHKDVHELVKKAIGILEYSGIVMIKDEGYKMHGGIYNRYQINIGILSSAINEPNVASYINRITKNLSIKVVTEYGKNSDAFINVGKIADNLDIEDAGVDIQFLLNKNIDILNISEYQKKAIREIGIKTLNDIIKEKECGLKKAHLIGDVRAREIYNQAMGSLLEYIMG